MGLDCSLLTKHIMKLLVVLSAVACSYAAPVADADAQVLAYGHGLLGGVYHAGVVPAATVAVAPAAAYHVAAPAVAEVKTVEVKAAPAVACPRCLPPCCCSSRPWCHSSCCPPGWLPSPPPGPPRPPGHCPEAHLHPHHPPRDQPCSCCWCFHRSSPCGRCC